jgi:hypothetical protein
MNDAELMTIIDDAIDGFKKGDGFGKKIKISKKPHSDWLVFEWRQLSWNENDINYVIGIYPNFNNNEEISSWSFTTAAWYDLNKKRFYIKHFFVQEKELSFITDHIDNLLSESFHYIRSIPKIEVPFAVDLK